MDGSHQARPPRAEPEILPPGHGPNPGQDYPRQDRLRQDDPRVVFVEMNGHTIRMVRPSLFTLLAIGGAFALVVALLVVVLLGAFLVSLPVLGFLFLALLIGGLLRRRRW